MTNIIDSILHDNEGNIIHPETNISMIRGTNDTDKTLTEELNDLKQEIGGIEELENKLNAEITRSKGEDTKHDTNISALDTRITSLEDKAIVDAGSSAPNYKGAIKDVSYVTSLPNDASAAENQTRLYLIPV